MMPTKWVENRLCDAAVITSYDAQVAHFVEEFRKRNDRNVIAVHADSESLLAMSQSAEVERTLPKVSYELLRTMHDAHCALYGPQFISTTDKFALGLAQSLSDIVDHVAAELQNHAHPPCVCTVYVCGFSVDYTMTNPLTYS